MFRNMSLVGYGLDMRGPYTQLKYYQIIWRSISKSSFFALVFRVNDQMMKQNTPNMQDVWLCECVPIKKVP